MWNRKLLLVLLWILIFLTGINVTGVCACSPVIYTDTTIITIDGEEFDNSPKYNYDLLFNKDDYPEYYQLEVNEQYMVDYLNYESFTFLDDGDWVSYKAHYSSDVDVWESGWNHEFNSMRENSIQEYKILVYDDNGNVIIISPTYDKGNFGFYGEGEDFGSIAHTFDETAVEFGEEAIGNGCAGWTVRMVWTPIIAYGGLGMLGLIVTVFSINIVRSKRR